MSVKSVKCICGLTFPHAPSPITTNLSCLSWLSSSESDMALNCDPTIFLSKKKIPGKILQVFKIRFLANHG